MKVVTRCTLAAVTLFGGAIGLAADRPAPATTRPAAETIRIPKTTVEFTMVRVPGGRITLKDDQGKETAHDVKPFRIGKHELTWDEYEIYYRGDDLDPGNRRREQMRAESRPSSPYENPDRGWGHRGWPAGSITFRQAGLYAKWLTAKTGKKFRLPTEAEWEWAARAGADKPLSVTQRDAAKVAWHADNSEEQTRAVGKLAPNPWGLYDTLGNVAEWVVTADGTGAVAGGSYVTEWKELGTAHRERYSPAWQRRDCQLPKSIDWLTDGMHVGIRLVMEE